MFNFAEIGTMIPKIEGFINQIMQVMNGILAEQKAQRELLESIKAQMGDKENV